MVLTLPIHRMVLTKQHIRWLNFSTSYNTMFPSKFNDNITCKICRNYCHGTHAHARTHTHTHTHTYIYIYAHWYWQTESFSIRRYIKKDYSLLAWDRVILRVSISMYTELCCSLCQYQHAYWIPFFSVPVLACILNSVFLCASISMHTEFSFPPCQYQHVYWIQLFSVPVSVRILNAVVTVTFVSISIHTG